MAWAAVSGASGAATEDAHTVRMPIEGGPGKIQLYAATLNLSVKSGRPPRHLPAALVKSKGSDSALNGLPRGVEVLYGTRRLRERGNSADYAVYVLNMEDAHI